MTGCVTRCVHGIDTGCDLTGGLDEFDATGVSEGAERIAVGAPYASVDERVPVTTSEPDSGFGEERGAVLPHPSAVVGVQMAEQHDVDVGGRETGRRQSRRQVAAGEHHVTPAGI